MDQNCRVAGLSKVAAGGVVGEVFQPAHAGHSGEIQLRNGHLGLVHFQPRALLTIYRSVSNVFSAVAPKMHGHTGENQRH